MHGCKCRPTSSCHGKADGARFSGRDGGNGPGFPTDGVVRGTGNEGEAEEHLGVREGRVSRATDAEEARVITLQILLFRSPTFSRVPRHGLAHELLSVGNKVVRFLSVDTHVLVASGMRSSSPKVFCLS